MSFDKLREAILYYKPLVYLPLNSPVSPGVELAKRTTVTVNGTLTYVNDGPYRTGGGYGGWSDANYIDVTGDAVLDLASSEITMMAFIRTAHIASGQRVIMERAMPSHAAPYYACMIAASGSGPFHWLSSAGTNAVGAALPITWSATRWDHYAFGWHNRGGGQGTDWLNGKVIYDNRTGEGGASGTFFTGGVIESTNQPLRIGRHANVTGEAWSGDLSHVAVFDRRIGRGPAMEIIEAARAG